MKHCISPWADYACTGLLIGARAPSLMSAASGAVWLHGAGAWLNSSLLYEALLAPKADC